MYHNAIDRDRETVEERLLTDYVGSNSDNPKYPEYYFRRCYRMSSIQRVTGANNDLTVLNNSLFFNNLLDNIAPMAPFEVNGVTFQNGFYLADVINLRWASFVKSLVVARDGKMLYLNDNKKVIEMMLKELLAFSKDVGELHNNRHELTLSTSYDKSCTRASYCIT
nr:hypothetical protein [Tanacetum cinerariifolium]